MKNYRLEQEPPSTDQEALDAMVFHVIKQGKRCALSSTCVYRHPDDDSLSCIVGSIMPDVLWSLDINESPSDDFGDDMFPGLNPIFLMECQGIHDKFRSDCSNWKYEVLLDLKELISIGYPGLVFPDIEALENSDYQEYPRPLRP